MTELTLPQIVIERVLGNYKLFKIWMDENTGDERRREFMYDVTPKVKSLLKELEDGHYNLELADAGEQLKALQDIITQTIQEQISERIVPLITQKINSIEQHSHVDTLEIVKMLIKELYNGNSEY